jgi:GAF domain-containing protein
MMNSQFKLELRQFSDACAEMISICDPGGQILYANPPLCAASGYAEVELLGQPVRVLDSPNANWEATTLMSAALRHNGKTLGILALDTDPYPDREAPRRALLMQVGELIAMALRRGQAQTAPGEVRNRAVLAADAEAFFLANMSRAERDAEYDGLDAGGTPTALEAAVRKLIANLPASDAYV